MITGDQFINVAVGWSTPPNGEPVWRTSISRAYYGAYHLACVFVEEFLQVNFRISHENIREALKSTEDKSAIQASGLLRDLHDMRKKADYRLKLNDISSSTAAHAVKLAHMIQQHLITASTTSTKDILQQRLLSWKAWRHPH